MTILLLALSYLLGATPTSYWVGKAFHGLDLREHGSGNLGATNSFRVLGWKSALPVMIVDVGKGFIPVWLFPQLAAGPFGWTLAFGGAAVVGHMFSLWVGFRGGKGVATSAGVFLGLAPWSVLGALAVWLVAVFASRMVSLASISAAVTLPFFVWLLPHRGGVGLVVFTVALALTVIWAHRSNIRRILRGEESRIGHPETTGTAS
ncbi:MAG TPA: glycerol-3-phosphate 1-O-acyltransferase PlsY [Longimicrobiales bacterium]|nr:glycerol-3-phosphate 1-O-acyltransferase PlsY [Longimicrobiales bacterium]